MRSELFVRDLAAARIGATFNFYREGEAAVFRRQRLARYLEERSGAGILLVGEAPGHRGARKSGIPFTSERQLTGAPPGEAVGRVAHAVVGEPYVRHPGRGGARAFREGLLEHAPPALRRRYRAHYA